MNQTEIDEISEAFNDAWEEYFGQEMFYVPLDSATTKNNAHPLYRDAGKRGKIYLWDEKKSFYGTLRTEEVKESGDMFGKDGKETFEVTFVTKELYDQGIHEIREEDLILAADREGDEKVYNIIAHSQKVQFGNNKIFTKLTLLYMGTRGELFP